MENLFNLWAQLALVTSSLIIATLEFLGYDTIPLWSELLPQLRAGLGLG